MFGSGPRDTAEEAGLLASKRSMGQMAAACWRRTRACAVSRGISSLRKWGVLTSFQELGRVRRIAMFALGDLEDHGQIRCFAGSKIRIRIRGMLGFEGDLAAQ